MVKVILLSGSRSEHGQTAQAMQAVAAGLEQNGAACETLILPLARMERCRQCEESGWGLCIQAGRCVIEDDFSAVIEKIRKSDLVVVATPVYYGDLSESLRALTDRMRRTCEHEAGRVGLQGKAAAGLCVAGGGGGGALACCLSLERVLRTCGFDVVDMMPVRRQNLSARLPMLKLMGNWLAENPSTSP